MYALFFRKVGEKIKLIINKNESLKLMRLTSFGYSEQWDRSLRNLIPFFRLIGKKKGHQKN